MSVGPELALFANDTGTPVVFVADPHPSLQNLRAVSTVRPLASEVGERMNGRPGPLTIRTVVFDPDESTPDAFGGPCVLAVSAGFASADELAALALAATDSGHPLGGTVVVNPYPSDNTTGLSPSVAPTTGTSIKESSSNGANGHRHGRAANPDRTLQRDRQPCRSGHRRELRGRRGDLHQPARHPRRGAPTLEVPGRGPARRSADRCRAPPGDPAEICRQRHALPDRAVDLGSGTGHGQRRQPAADPSGRPPALSTQLHLHESAEVFLASYQGLAVSNTILSITYSADSPEAAIAGANAVAQSFLDVRTHELELQTGAVVNDLQSQINALNSEINRLGPTIDTLSSSASGAPSSGSELASLIAQRNEDSSQVTQLEGEIQQDYLNAKTVTGASQILAPAAEIPVSAKKVALVDGLSGLVAGLGLALMVLVVSVLLSDRLRTRAEVAEVLNAPVEVSIRRFPRRRRPSLRSLRHLLEQPNRELVMIDRRLRDHVDALGLAGPGGGVRRSRRCSRSRSPARPPHWRVRGAASSSSILPPGTPWRRSSVCRDRTESPRRSACAARV